MKKLPLVLALSAAMGAPFAGAQENSNVQIYGKLYPYVEQESGSGQSAVGTPRATLAPAATGVKGVLTLKGMSAGNSYLGFRGKEDLGGGLFAIYQLEGTALVDSGTAGLWQRNTFVGLGGKQFGTVKLGFFDTVFKEYGDTLGILGISSGTPVSSSNILRKPGYGTSNNARFHERRANSARYDSPELGGFQGALQVATLEAGVAATTPAPAKTYSLGVKYDSGPFYAALAYEQHDNWFGGSTGQPAALSNIAQPNVKSKDRAVQATFEWRINKEHAVEFDAIRKSYNENPVAAGRFQNYNNMAYMVAYDGRFGGLWRVMAHYVRSQAGSCSLSGGVACTTTGLEGQQLTAGVAYSLSKRTFIYGVASQIRNGAAARFAATDLGGAPTAGEDVRHLMAGISHSF